MFSILLSLVTTILFNQNCSALFIGIGDANIYLTMHSTINFTNNNLKLTSMLR